MRRPACRNYIDDRFVKYLCTFFHFVRIVFGPLHFPHFTSETLRNNSDNVWKLYTYRNVINSFEQEIYICNLAIVSKILIPVVNVWALYLTDEQNYSPCLQWPTVNRFPNNSLLLNYEKRRFLLALRKLYRSIPLAVVFNCTALCYRDSRF